MQCEICGAEAPLYKVKIEGTIMNVCANCMKYGEPVRTVTRKIPIKTPIVKSPEIVEDIVPGYAEIIRKAREAKGLKQEEFAKKINEKESIIHKVETGHFKPSLQLAKKIENFLGVKLIERIEASSDLPKTTEEHEETGFTLGDFVRKSKNF